MKRTWRAVPVACLSIWLFLCRPVPGQQVGLAEVPSSTSAGNQAPGAFAQQNAPQPAATEALPQPQSAGTAATQQPGPDNPGAATDLPLAQIAPPSQYPDVQVLTIDLPTALQLVNASNPTIALARERVREDAGCTHGCASALAAKPPDWASVPTS